jgi:hypothetical protein
MKTKFVLLAVCFLLSTAVADTLSVRKPQLSRVGVYMLEGLAALPGMAGCYCLGMGFGAIAYMNSGSVGGKKSAIFVGAVSLSAVSLALLPPTAAWGTISVGERLGRHGSRGWAIGGSYAGLAVAVGSMASSVAIANYSLRHRTGRYWYVPFLVLSGLAVPVGAVVGYNVGAPRGTGPFGSRYRGRIELPAVALTSLELPDHSVEYGVKVQLAGLRF